MTGQTEWRETGLQSASFHEQVARLAEQLVTGTDKERRLVAIVGAPGSGKTTLGKALAAQ